jgi:hypothetical protein
VVICSIPSASDWLENKPKTQWDQKNLAGNLRSLHKGAGFYIISPIFGSGAMPVTFVPVRGPTKEKIQCTEEDKQERWQPDSCRIPEYLITPHDFLVKQ